MYIPMSVKAIDVPFLALFYGVVQSRTRMYGRLPRGFNRLELGLNPVEKAFQPPLRRLKNRVKRLLLLIGQMRDSVSAMFLRFG